MRFEARDLKPYGEPVTADTLVAGEVYFSVQFVDRDGLVPIMETLVFIGRNISPDAQGLYFQDVESYSQGIRYESATPDDDSFFYVQAEKHLNHIYDYEHALERLMECSLRRRKPL